jgi:hypothetical protein
LGTVQTIKIDFVSTSVKSGAKLSLSTAGTFLQTETVGSTTTKNVSLTVKNRDDGVIRSGYGEPVTPTMSLLDSDGAIVTANENGTSGLIVANDSGSDGVAGTYDRDAGTGLYNGNNGTFGVTFDANRYTWDVDGNTIRAVYGASVATQAITAFAASGAGLASATNTDVLVTAAGMSAAHTALNTANSVTDAWTLPTTTKTATVKFWIKTSSDTATPAAAITVKPTWGGAFGTSLVSPATSTTGTVYTTDALGNFTVTVTNDAPVAGASLTLVLSGGAAFGADTYTATLTWAVPTITSIEVIDPVAGITVLTGSTNVTTVLVKDQFGNPMKDQVVTVSSAVTPSALTPTTAVAPLTTGANGTAAYSYTPPTGATGATLTFRTVPATNAPTFAYVYAATLPVVGTMVAYHGLTWGSATTLTPATGIYSSGTTRLAIEDVRDLTERAVADDSSDLNDQIAIRFTGLTAAGASATGAAVTVTAGTGGWILDALGAPVKSRVYAISSGTTPAIPLPR